MQMTLVFVSICWEWNIELEKENQVLTCESETSGSQIKNAVSEMFWFVPKLHFRHPRDETDNNQTCIFFMISCTE